MITDTLNELYRIFDILNGEFYESLLERPIITIQKSRPNNLGHFTLSKIWKNKETDDRRYEININPINMDRPIEEIICTLHHEMVHYWNKVNEINDCNGQIHNKKFKTKAESVDMIVEKSKKYGYGHTSLNERLKSYINDTIKPNKDSFDYFMNIKLEEIEKKPVNKKTFKYVCPSCGMEVKAKTDLNIICGECNSKLEMEE